MVISKVLRIPKKCKEIIKKNREALSKKKVYNNQLKIDKAEVLLKPDAFRINFIGFPESREADWIANFPLNMFFPDFAKKRIISFYKPQIEYYSCFEYPKKISKSKAPVKIFWTGEDVINNYKDFSNHLLPDVDLAIGFCPESMISEEYRFKYIRYPLWLLYYFIGESYRIFTKDRIASVVNQINSKRNKHSEFCSLVARHDRNGIRKSIMDCIGNIDNIKCPGSVFHNDDSLKSVYSDDKVKYLENFMFNICPENTDVDGYVTEKLFQSFDSGCIPLYNGGGAYLEPNVVNKKAIIYFDSDYKEDFFMQVKELWTNRLAYEDFIKQPKLLDSSVDWIYDKMTELKDRYDELFSKIL